MNLQIYEISQNLLRVMLSNKNVINQTQFGKIFNIRVWSWLRTNAGGVLKTCKSNGTNLGTCTRVGLVADGWVTREQSAYHWGITTGNGC